MLEADSQPPVPHQVYASADPNIALHSCPQPFLTSVASILLKRHGDAKSDTFDHSLAHLQNRQDLGAGTVKE